MLIGKTVTVKDAKNATLKGMHGNIIDETKHTITITTSKGTRTIIKEQLISIEETS
jgi:RNase P/RNase MRP subunit p29